MSTPVQIISAQIATSVKTESGKITHSAAKTASAVALFNEAKKAAATNPSLDISQLAFSFPKEEAA